MGESFDLWEIPMSQKRGTSPDKLAERLYDHVRRILASTRFVGEKKASECVLATKFEIRLVERCNQIEPFME